MKCIPSCGYIEKPDNLTKLKRHMEDCLDHGACSKLKKDPFVIWKDNEFTVSEKKTKKDLVFEVDLIKKKRLELKENQVKKLSDYVTKATVTQGTVSDNLEKPAKSKLKAKLDEGLEADSEGPTE